MNIKLFFVKRGNQKQNLKNSYNNIFFEYIYVYFSKSPTAKWPDCKTGTSNLRQQKVLDPTSGANKNHQQ